MRTVPMGAKTRPMMKRVGRTVLGVRMGCHALRRCCLKAVSECMGELAGLDSDGEIRTCWTTPTGLFLGGALGGGGLFLLAVEERHGGRKRERE